MRASSVLRAPANSARCTCQTSSSPRDVEHALIVIGECSRLRARRSAESFSRPVVRDDNLRLDRREQSRRARAVERAVAARLPDRNGSDQVGWTNELDLLLPIEISEIEEPEAPVREERRHHQLVLWNVRRMILERRAARFVAAARLRLGDELAVRGHDDHIDAFERNPVPGLQDRALVVAHAQIGVSPALICRFDEVAPIVAAVERHELRQRDHSAGVIGMEMAQHEMIDLVRPAACAVA